MPYIPSGGYTNPLNSIKRVSGTWIAPIAPNNSSTNTAVNQLALVPWIADTAFGIQNIQVDITAVTTAGHYEVGIYADNGNGYPGKLLLDTGPIVVAAAQLYVVPVAFSFIPNTIYWIGGVVTDGAMTWRSINTIYQPPFAPRQLGAPASGAYGCGLYQGGIAASPLPNPFIGNGLTYVIPRFVFQVA